MYSNATNRKLTIAAGIFPPDIGGPAGYVVKLGSALVKRGWGVDVVCYTDVGCRMSDVGYDFSVFRVLRGGSKLVRYFKYFLRVMKVARDSDVIYAQGPISAGLPAMLGAKFLRKKFVIRLGGDPLWEQAVEESRTRYSLNNYYEKEKKTLKEKFLIFVINKVLKAADKIIFTTSFQKEIYKKYFNVKEDKIVIIANPFPVVGVLVEASYSTPRTLLYAGRLMKLKNLDVLIEVFAEVIRKNNKLLILKIIGDGFEKERLRLKVKNLKIEDQVIFEKPIIHQEILKEIQKSYLCILPSLTDISPNFALECLMLGKPILLTKETGLNENLKNNLILIDPQNERDIKEKINYLLDEDNYQAYCEKIPKINKDWDWDKVTEQHILIFRNL